MSQSEDLYKVMILGKLGLHTTLIQPENRIHGKLGDWSKNFNLMMMMQPAKMANKIQSNADDAAWVQRLVSCSLDFSPVCLSFGR